jgi:outer membrane protein OmpA-like peptidoglycan-associated protein
MAVATLLIGCGAEQAVKKGDKFYALGEYFDAAAQYRKAYSQTPAKERALRGQRALKMADCYRRINYTQKAIAAYNNAIRYKQADSLTHLYLAQQLMKNGSYKEAAKQFQQFLDSVEANTLDGPSSTTLRNATLSKREHPSPLTQLARTGLKSAQKAPEWKKQGSDYTVKRENFFNSRRADYSPMLAGEENNQLFFTSTRNQAKGDEVSGITGTKNGDIFVSQKDEKGKWQRPEVIDSELNSDFDEGVCSFTPDGRTMYLTQCKTDPDYPRFATIMTSNRSDASWGKATELKLTRDTLSAFAHPAVSPDGQWLYFCSNMPGGLGGYDIWRIRLTTSGVGGVENLGAPINTPGNEMFPTFRPNGDLYFSSDGHEGMGGLDIYIAKAISNEQLVISNDDYLASEEDASTTNHNSSFLIPHSSFKISHPGYPLNSQGDDFGMTFEGMKNQGYFSSNRGDGKGWDHIYSFYNPEIIQTVTGWVYEKDGYELPQGQVYMVGNDGTNLKLSVKGDGSFTQEIKAGVDYVFLGTCKGFLNHQEQLRVEPVTKSEEYTLQFPLASITAPVLIDNIFYDFDKATLRPESTEALDQLVKLLNENPHVTIELSAHTDYKGSNEYNERLSQRRAESVVKYLIEHGIASDRLTPKGYGEEKPKTIRRKLTEKYPFLKEKDVLTEEFVKTLENEEQQEQCNQLNRRTEFRVLRTTYGLFPKK